MIGRPSVSEIAAAASWLVDADGDNERLLVADTGAAIHGIGPVWSPTGDRIAYQRLICDWPNEWCGERHEVVLVNVSDGTETVIERPVTDGPNGPVRWWPRNVTWSPDGTMLLYSAWPDHGYTGVLVVPADMPSDVTVLTDASPPVGFDGIYRWVLVQVWGRQPG